MAFFLLSRRKRSPPPSGSSSSDGFRRYLLQQSVDPSELEAMDQTWSLATATLMYSTYLLYSIDAWCGPQARRSLEDSTISLIGFDPADERISVSDQSLARVERKRKRREGGRGRGIWTTCMSSLKGGRAIAMKPGLGASGHNEPGSRPRMQASVG
ncbi:hypothetical protein CP533_5107 [Ophiocordyceps camponoti-saundersi (nom. inval.)]|nr:hypothetical protein CP533_5107 [Ophiocordyceps camponoti-saundersi (nom. inval.)]